MTRSSNTIEAPSCEHCIHYQGSTCTRYAPRSGQQFPEVARDNVCGEGGFVVVKRLPNGNKTNPYIFPLHGFYEWLIHHQPGERLVFLTSAQLG